MHCTITAPGHATNLTGVKLGLSTGRGGHWAPVPASRIDVAGESADLVVLVPHAPKGPGLGLHRCARTVHRDAGATSPHLLLNTGRDGPHVEIDAPNLHEVLRSGTVRRIVRLARHRAGGSLRTDHFDDIEWRDDTGGLRTVRATELSVRDDLLEGGDVDALAAEVSLALLDTSGLLLERITL